jgi:AraC family transcriptional regulator
MNVRFQHCEPQRVVYVRHVGPYQECGKAWQTLMALAGQHGLLAPGALSIGIGHDNPDVTPPDKLRYDACLTVAGNFQAVEGLALQEIPGGEYAVATLRGPYAQLPDAYRWIFRDWLPASGRKLRHAPCYEIYVTDPRTTAEADLVTEIYVPLEG